MKEAFVLHSIADAEHYARQGHNGNALLFSTHSCVDTYLKDFHGLECNCLSGFFDIDEMISRRDISWRLVDEVLALLDNKISPQINQATGLKIDYFKTLYSFAGRHQFPNYVFFLEAIRRICDSHKLDRVHLYDLHCNFFLDTATDMGTLASLCLHDLPYDVVQYIPDKLRLYSLSKLCNISSMPLFKRLKDPLGTLKKVCNKISIERKLQSYKKLSPQKKTILISEYLYELKFLLNENFGDKYNIIYYRHSGKCLVEDNTIVDVPELKIRFEDITDNFGEYNPYVNLFIRDVCFDFSQNIGSYLKNIQKLAALKRKYPISLGIWGVDPILGDKAMRYAYLRSEGVKILGSEHGGLYGEVLNYQFETGFHRCDYFIGYGFTKEDLLRVAPEKSPGAEILPIGKTELVRPRQNSKHIDILFPVTNTVSMFKGGMRRFPPDRLTERQLALLEYLNSLIDTTVYVKPFLGANHTNLSAWTKLSKLRNLHLCDHLTLNSFLDKYEPRAIIIEFPSQPLWEVIHLDTEIFLMGDPVIPWERQALDELTRRVHYSEDTDEMIQMIDSFLKGELTTKRDNTYFNHYVSREHARENTLKIIDDLVEGAGYPQLIT